MKPPGSLCQALLSATVFHGTELWTLHVLTCRLARTPLHPAGFEHHLQIQYLVPSSFLFTPCYMPPTIPFPEPDLRKNKFYINRQMCKKLLDLNNVVRNLYFSSILNIFMISKLWRECSLFSTGHLKLKSSARVVIAMCVY